MGVETAEPMGGFIINATCTRCKWSDQVSIRAGEPTQHIHEIIESTKDDLREAHVAYTPNCPEQISFSYK